MLHLLHISITFNPRRARNPLILLNINQRSGQLRSKLIPRHNDSRLRLKEPINIFESPVGCLGVEEVCDRDEGEADDCPYNPEFVAEVFDAGQGSLDNRIVLE